MKGSKIWKLCKGVAPLILDHLGWKAGNGKRIQLRKDHLHMKELLNQTPKMHELADRMKAHQLVYIADLSTWYDNGHWRGWVCPVVPEHLLFEWSMMKHALKGCTPISTKLVDERTWTASSNLSYSVKTGYDVLLHKRGNLSSVGLWKSVLGKILIAENLKKRKSKDHPDVSCAKRRKSQLMSFQDLQLCSFCLEGNIQRSYRDGRLPSVLGRDVYKLDSENFRGNVQKTQQSLSIGASSLNIPAG